ncbi:hypothetical protein G6F40_013127 [Rhizopus arrhizus]|nr:hypothetical protein G6F40_013127 [Rhizopus arrhizus]
MAAQRRVDLGRNVALGLAQDVADALVGRGQRLGFRQRSKGADRIQAAVEVVKRGRLQLGHRIEMRGRHALVGVVALQAVEDEVVQLADVGLHVARGQAGVGAGQQRAQVQLEAALDDRAGQAQRIAAQGERVLVAGRLQARGETTGQRVHAFSNRQHRAQRRQRDGIATEARLVGLVDGQRDLGRFATGHGVVAAGDALQFREFVDHARLQVVLRQFGGTPCLRSVGANLRRDHLGQGGHAGDLVGHAAQLGLVGHRLQALAHRRQALLQVFVEEELGIGEARADHALVALGHFGHVLRFDVGDADELLGQRAAVIQHREELLVDLHRLDQRFLRHRQERALEAAQHRRGPLDQRLRPRRRCARGARSGRPARTRRAGLPRNPAAVPATRPGRGGNDGHG